MKVWITKYALTHGIMEKDAKVVARAERMIIIPSSAYQEAYHKPYWHESKSDAVVHAEKMKSEKIKSLQKSIGKLEKLSFA